MGSFSVKYGTLHKHGGYGHSDNGGRSSSDKGDARSKEKNVSVLRASVWSKNKGGGGGPGSPSPFPISATDERVKRLDLEVEPPRIKVTLSTRPSPEKNAS